MSAVIEEAKEIAKARREQVIPMPMDISAVAQHTVDPIMDVKANQHEWIEEDYDSMDPFR